MEKDTFYITTPIYYPSDKLHIGHTYCTVATDTLARYHRLKGEDVMFLTGTDEHGQKIEQKADEAGVTPQEFVDRIVDGPRGVRDLWKLMNISNDRFIRTTDDYHVKAIQRIFKRMYDKGDIYKGTYKGKYCTPCESFWTESQLKDGCCPDCGRPVVDAEEEAYFFRLSKYADRIRDLLENTDFLQPRSRVNEMVKNFLDPGLEDLCVSRTSFTWGIPVDFDSKHVVYVWVDALFNYLTALGYDERTVELARIAGFLHDIGNVINRVDHAQSGAVMAFRLLDNMGADAEDIATIISAIGNHDEGTAVAVDAVAAALILADKTDVRRTRVRNRDMATFDIHDRVNYAVEESSTAISGDKKSITLQIRIDTELSSVMDYFEIFLDRMLLCRKAAERLGLKFRLVINGQTVL